MLLLPPLLEAVYILLLVCVRILFRSHPLAVAQDRFMHDNKSLVERV